MYLRAADLFSHAGHSSRRNNTRRLHDHDSAMSLFTAARGELWFFSSHRPPAPHIKRAVQCALILISPIWYYILYVCVLLKFTCVCAHTSGRLFALSGAHLLSIYLWMWRVMDICAPMHIIRHQSRFSHAATATKSASHHPADPIQSKHADQTFVPSNFISSASPHAQKPMLFCEMFMSVRDCCWRHC